MANEQQVVAESFIPLEGIMGKVVTCLYVNIGIDVVSAFVTAFSAMMAERAHGNLEDPGYGLSLMLTFVAAMAQVTITIVCAVFFCKWMYRAYKNLFWFGTQELAGTPKRAVWSWFIPFWNLVWPYKHMSEIWQASDPRAGAVGWKNEKLPKEFGWWWGFWIGQALLANVAARMEMKAGDAGSRVGDGLDILSDVLSVMAAVLVIRIVKGITERQEHKSHATTTNK